MTSKRRGAFALVVAVCAGLGLSAGCGPQPSVEHAAEVRQQPLDGLPYHPVVLHLDLAILAYHLYGQSLVWPFDPYYEEANSMRWDRAKLMARVHAWTQRVGPEQVARGAGLDAYRGPGVLGGFANNLAHDPIVYRYDQLHPWSHSVTNAEGRWTEYRTPRRITDRIGAVHVCARPLGQPAGAVAVTRLPDRGPAGARDGLFVFEGVTGDKGEPGQPGAQSLMGYVLVRHHADDAEAYDLHVAFRGSRSGSAVRAAVTALSDSAASGNPDWITDLGYDQTDAVGEVTTTGTVARGFAHSMKATLPTLFGCLEAAATFTQGRAPARISVTGHSLGGALAQHFASAVLLGDAYGPGGAGPRMPASMKAWPWANLKLVTFSAPRAGDATWARALTADRLQSTFWQTTVDPYDREAFAVTHPALVPRLTARDRPAAYRVLISTDPITTEKVAGGKHVGKTVYVDHRGLLGAVRKTNGTAHEPIAVRAKMLAALADSRIPGSAWAYLPMQTLNPEREGAAKGSAGEYRRLIDAVARYHADRGLWIDAATRAADAEAFLKVLTAPR